MSAMSLNRRIANHQATGLLGAFSAYLVWGLQPIYWKYFAGLDSWIVIAHRYCWSCVFLILVLFFSGKLEHYEKEPFDQNCGERELPRIAHREAHRVDEEGD